MILALLTGTGYLISQANEYSVYRISTETRGDGGSARVSLLVRGVYRELPLAGGDALVLDSNKLPRVSWLKGWGPLNIPSFSLYHFFTLWENPIRILEIAPMVHDFWWKKNIYFGMIVHCAANTAGSIGMLAVVLAGS